MGWAELVYAGKRVQLVHVDASKHCVVNVHVCVALVVAKIREGFLGINHNNTSNNLEKAEATGAWGLGTNSAWASEAAKMLVKGFLAPRKCWCESQRWKGRS
jgi:hypothetical protein